MDQPSNHHVIWAISSWESLVGNDTEADMAGSILVDDDVILETGTSSSIVMLHAQKQQK